MYLKNSLDADNRFTKAGCNLQMFPEKLFILNQSSEKLNGMEAKGIQR